MSQTAARQHEAPDDDEEDVDEAPKPRQSRKKGKKGPDTKATHAAALEVLEGGKDEEKSHGDHEKAEHNEKPKEEAKAEPPAPTPPDPHAIEIAVQRHSGVSPEPKYPPGHNGPESAPGFWKKFGRGVAYPFKKIGQGIKHAWTKTKEFSSRFGKGLKKLFFGSGKKPSAPGGHDTPHAPEHPPEGGAHPPEAAH